MRKTERGDEEMTEKRKTREFIIVVGLLAILIVAVYFLIRHIRTNVTIKDKDLASTLDKIVDFEWEDTHPEKLFNERFRYYKVDDIYVNYCAIEGSQLILHLSRRLSEWKVTVHSEEPTRVQVVNHYSHLQTKPHPSETRKVVAEVIQQVSEDIEWYKKNEEALRSYYAMKKNANQFASNLREIIARFGLPPDKWYEFTINDALVKLYLYQYRVYDYELRIERGDTKVVINTIYWTTEYSEDSGIHEIEYEVGDEIKFVDIIARLEQTFVDFSAKSFSIKERYKGPGYKDQKMDELSQAFSEPEL